MNIALTHIHAAASACSCGKNAFIRALVLGCAVACAGAPAFAGQDREHERDGPRSQQQGPREQPPPRAERAPPQQRPDARQYDVRQFDPRAADDQHRQAAPQEQGGRRGGRLTPDERRELRRQINEAGIDLYPNPPRR